MADLAEDTLTTIEDRLYFTLDAAVTITGDVATVPTGFTELDVNSTWKRSGKGDTGDATTRATRGHKKDVVTLEGAEITFNIKPAADSDPAQDLEIKVRSIMRLLLVKADGHYVCDLVQVTSVDEESTIGQLPGWSGTASVRAHAVRGKITTWPPVPGP
jgi:hypothetical protein